MPTFDYGFSEPLMEVGVYSSSDVEGVAVIDYNRDGDWGITSISLDAYDPMQPVGKRWLHGKIPLDPSSEIYKLLHARLNARHAARYIQDEVNEKIDEDRQPDPDRIYDEWRDRRAEAAE